MKEFYKDRVVRDKWVVGKWCSIDPPFLIISSPLHPHDPINMDLVDGLHIVAHEDKLDQIEGLPADAKAYATKEVRKYRMLAENETRNKVDNTIGIMRVQDGVLIIKFATTEISYTREDLLVKFKDKTERLAYLDKYDTERWKVEWNGESVKVLQWMGDFWMPVSDLSAEGWDHAQGLVPIHICKQAEYLWKERTTPIVFEGVVYNLRRTWQS